LQLGKLANLTMYGMASKSKHYILTEYGATPIDYHTQDFVEVIRQAEPEGLDAVFEKSDHIAWEVDDENSGCL
jgi:NADPH-dependent curcumin reductase CurA